MKKLKNSRVNRQPITKYNINIPFTYEAAGETKALIDLLIPKK